MPMNADGFVMGHPAVYISLLTHQLTDVLLMRHATTFLWMLVLNAYLGTMIAPLRPLVLSK